jgi:hypothetical protein
MNIPFTRKYNGSILGCWIKWLALKIINLLITKDEKENTFHPWLIIIRENLNLSKENRE